MVENRSYSNVQYDKIVEDQVSIAYLSKCIDLSYTDDISPYDRELIMNLLLKFKDIEADSRKGDGAPRNKRRSTRY
jgi:hypothetical protein